MKPYQAVSFKNFVSRLYVVDLFWILQRLIVTTLQSCFMTRTIKGPVTQKHIEIKYPWLDQILVGQIVIQHVVNIDSWSSIDILGQWSISCVLCLPIRFCVISLYRALNKLEAFISFSLKIYMVIKFFPFSERNFIGKDSIWQIMLSFPFSFPFFFSLSFCFF